MTALLPLAPRARLLFHLRALASLGFLWLPLVLALSGVVTVIWSPLVAGGLASALLFALFVLALWWPSLQFSRWGYALEEDRLVVSRGVLTLRITAIPVGRVQHVDLHQGPLEQWLRLAQVQVYTASGLGADGVIPGLDLAVAERLRDELVARAHLQEGGDDGV
ncbi:MAG: PH domain-containing protein [Deltaproteobacteria bacterium]|nr:PH domain-containing protein [Deltaproteobacteria bacterium]